MAAVSPPAVTYTPAIPREAIISGRLSEAQMEAVIYAGQAHQEHLPNGDRRGFFIGDGTGVGKGREAAAIIWDSWLQGRRKAVWISEKAELINDAKRDIEGLGWNADVLFNPPSAKQSINREKGVLFITYDTLKSKGSAQPKKTRLDQVKDWLGDDFDGVIIFDESHNMGNTGAAGAGGDNSLFGNKKAAQKAMKGVELQDSVTDARVVYLSATGATSPENLGYISRLGAWGEGTPFPKLRDFVGAMEKGGVAAMELVAQGFKAMGSYIARSLDYRGVEYDTLTHKLTPDQIEIYDNLARAWQMVLDDVMAAVGQTGASKQAVTSARRNFWAAHQAFFNQLITAMQMPSVISAIKKDLAEGRAPVLQLVNTNAENQERALDKRREGQAIEDLDTSTKATLMEYVSNSFPTQQYEEYTDDSGRTRERRVEDSAGNPVQNAEAVRMRDNLLQKLGAIRVPASPLEMLYQEFEADDIAEVTGRGRRIVYRQDENGVRRAVEEKSSPKSRATEVDEFMDDRRKILVFSRAGGTGRSYHADLNAKNQRPRMHYLVQPGWQADNAVQGLGRTHRSNQKQPPTFRLVTTDLKGQKRFISSISRKLDQLGALTKGQRQTGSQGFFRAKDNLESSYAREALRRYLQDVVRAGVNGITADIVEKEMGLALRNKEGQVTEASIPSMAQFLNRVLSVTVGNQNQIFDGFEKYLDEVIEEGTRNGTLDVGVETVQSIAADKEREQVVYADPKSGAEIKYVKIVLTLPARRLDFESAKTKGHGFLVSKKTGKVFAIGPETDYTNAETGKIETARWLDSPSGSSKRDKVASKEYRRRVDEAEARELWEAELAALGDTRTESLHMFTGPLFAIWDKIPGDPRVKRVQTTNGERLLGGTLNGKNAAVVLQRLGVTGEFRDLTPEQVVDEVMSGDVIHLNNGWSIARSLVSGENRMELKGPDFKFLDQLKNMGVIADTIDWQTRYFVPRDKAKSERILAKLLEQHKILAAPPDTKFATADARTKPRGIGGEQASKWVGEVQKRWPGGPTIELVQAGKDLPANILADAKTRGISHGSIRAATSGQQVYVVLDNLDNRKDFERTLQHEAIVHFGVRAALGENETNRFFDDLAAWLNKRGDRVTGARQAEEWLARRVEAGDYQNAGPVKQWFNRLVTKVMSGLRKAGFKNTMTKAEVGDAVARSIKTLRQPKRKPTSAPTRFSSRGKLTTVEQYGDELIDKKVAEAAPEEKEEARKALEEERERFKKEFPDIVKTSWADIADAWAKGWIKPPRDFVKGRDDSGWLERVFSTPEYYFEKIPAAGRVVNAALQKVDNAHHNLDQLLNDSNGISYVDTLRKLQKANPEQYKALSDLLVEADRENKVYGSMENDDGSLSLVDPNGDEVLGLDSQTVAAWEAYREVMDRGLEMLMQDMKDYLAKVEAAGLPAPEVVIQHPGGDISVDLKYALARMNDLRGSYAPRLRKSGRYQLTAKHANLPPVLVFNDYKTPLRKQASALRFRGYKTVLSKTANLPESVYEGGASVMDVQAVMNKALRDVEKKQKTTPQSIEDFGFEKKLTTDDDLNTYLTITGKWNMSQAQMFKSVGGEMTIEDTSGTTSWRFDTTAHTEDSIVKLLQLQAGLIPGSVDETFAAALTQQVADVMRGRGFRASMIKRQEGDVWLGYEEDPLLNMTTYASAVAHGMAKKKMAADMMKAVTGTDLDFAAYEERGLGYDEYLAAVRERRIAPEEQPNIYKDVKLYMTDMLKNEEFDDRIVGMVKGLAVLKYLGFRVSSPLVNLTALGTTVPAAMNAYGKIPISKAPRYLGKAMDNFTRYHTGGKLSPADWWLFDRIKGNGWDEAQYNNEAMTVLRSQVGNGWSKFMDASMWMFARTEQLNRAATIAGAYYGIMEHNKEMTPEDALKLAKKVSDRSHGTYGKATLPYAARGDHIGAQAVKSFYVFTKFSHNFVLLLKDMGVEQKNAKASMYLLLSPIMFGGLRASLATTVAIGIMAVLTGDDEPDEGFYHWLEKTAGEYPANIARFGVPGMFGHGVSLRGSLEINLFDVPTKFWDILGAPGSVIADVYEGGEFLAKGNYSRAAESLLPLAFANPVKAVREYTEGLTTKRGDKVFYAGEHYKPDWIDTALRALSFNPSRVAKVHEMRYRAIKKRSQLNKERGQVGDEARSWFDLPPEERTRTRYLEMVSDAKKVNAKIRDANIRAEEQQVSRYGTGELTSEDIRHDIGERLRDFFSREPDQRPKSEYLALMSDVDAFNQWVRDADLQKARPFTEGSIKHYLRESRPEEERPYEFDIDDFNPKFAGEFTDFLTNMEAINQEGENHPMYDRLKETRREIYPLEDAVENLAEYGAPTPPQYLTTKFVHIPVGNGPPYKTRRGATNKKKKLAEMGIKTEVVGVPGGYAVEVVNWEESIVPADKREEEMRKYVDEIFKTMREFNREMEVRE